MESLQAAPPGLTRKLRPRKLLPGNGAPPGSQQESPKERGTKRKIMDESEEEEKEAGTFYVL